MIMARRRLVLSSSAITLQPKIGEVALTVLRIAAAAGFSLIWAVSLLQFAMHVVH